MKKIIVGLFLCFTYIHSIAQVVINEYSCSNISTVLDAYNQRNDWVEFYNSGASNVNLTGYYLSDDPNNLTKFLIPAVTDITPNGRKMMYCSGRGLVHAGTGQIHTSFKLRQCDNEWFILTDPSGLVIVDSVFLGNPRTQVNHAAGRTTDGAATWSVFNTPTPNAANANAKDGYATTPIFSLSSGNYTVAQNVSLSSPDPNITIYYTTNGTIPSATNGTAYATPINITATTAIRAIAISSNPLILPSIIKTNTYFMNESSTFDVVSVCGPYNTASSLGGPNLFNGGQAIYSSFEFFNNTLTPQFDYIGRASRHGNDSWAYQQKGIDFEVLDETGTRSSMDYPLFSTTLRNKFDRIMLKAGGSDNFPTGFPNNSCHIRDAFAQTLAEKYQLDMDFRRWMPALMFVNGNYWGLYDMRERVDGDFFEYYYGKNRDKCDHLSYWGGLQVRLGSDTGWVNLYNFIMANNMAVQSNYDHVKEFLNTKSFIQYFIFNTYLVNHDWLNWNTMWWRGRGNSNNIKWRYVLWDEDAITGLQNPNYTGLSTTSFEFDPCEPVDLFNNNSNIKHTDMLKRLLNNAEFTQQYRGEWINMLNGCFECTHLLNHFDSVVAIINPEMTRQATNWGGTYANWQANVASMRSFLQSRCAVIAQKLDSCMQLNPQPLKLNVFPANSGTIAMDGSLKSPYVWSQIIEADSIYELSATPTAGPYWSFDYWELTNAANSVNPNINTATVNYNFTDNDSVIAHFKYFNYDSIDVTFDVQPVNTGTIKLEGNLLPFYPYTIKLSRLKNYQIEATPNLSYIFVDWTKNNSTTNFVNNKEPITFFDYDTTDVITANFLFLPPPPPPPPIPDIDKTVFIPNAFSPNGDGRNDIFDIKISPDVTGMLFRVYDRWGQLIFESRERRGGWNGTYNGFPADIGVYQYYIQLKYRDGSNQVHRGDVSLIR